MSSLFLYLQISSAWSTPTIREDGALLHEHEIAYYTIYKNDEILDYSIHNTYTLKLTDKCSLYSISVTDTDNLESKKSPKICVCKETHKRQR